MPPRKPRAMVDPREPFLQEDWQEYEAWLDGQLMLTVDEVNLELAAVANEGQPVIEVFGEFPL